MQGDALHSVSFYKYWGCSVPLSKISGVLERLQLPSSYLPELVGSGYFYGTVNATHLAILTTTQEIN